MASNPPGRCCVTGARHEGSPRGEIKTFNDVEVYITYPEDKSTENAILFLTDVMGHRFINAQLIADGFAENGYFVYMPDLFHGDPVSLNPPEDFDIMGWLNGPPGHLTDRVDPVVQASISEMRKTLGCKKIGGVGYCFGAKYVVRNLGYLSGSGDGLDAGYVAHPSFVERDELQAIKKPLAISAAETDSIFPTSKRHESEEILIGTKIPYQINLFSGVEHGFAVRLSEETPVGNFAKEQAFVQAITWFNMYLRQSQ
ncbi:Dienelactone hydrolase [Trichoderma simmonsii]|uniref:Dienelactone hydrolase n=1 Tax=Trichoderma simmonsii TaxID=1491479 RepID=A0A8G0LG69_9HYPO|nr:Dienelactone hydrolase [Trichoderma simmonsii]